ncbi:MAG: hypothetical protein LBD22_02790 [Spirochaetaceae bacterium]|jgi:hypothetical protein|nr:hypothetical protein [Spirochaetaceae bacterium]
MFRKLPASQRILSIVLALIPPVLFFVPVEGAVLPQTSFTGYAILTFDESLDEAEVCAKLTHAGINNFFAASNQTAFLNEFSAVEEIPLDEYTARVESYDPRNDGYAEKARALFLGNGTRRIFIPARELSSFGMPPPDERIKTVLSGMPVKLAAADVQYNTTQSMIIFALACCVFILLARKIAALSNDKFLFWCALSLIPSFALFARNGAGGLAACAVLLAFFQTVRVPLLRFFTGLCPGVKIKVRSLTVLFNRDTLVSFIRELAPETIKLGVLTVLYGGICAAAAIPVSVFAPAFLCFMLCTCGLAVCEAAQGPLADHARFVFIPIRCTAHKFPTLPLPFLGAMCAALIVPVVSGGGMPETVLPAGVVSSSNVPAQEDYQRHIEFQRDFAYRKLGASEDDAHEYLHYSRGENSLISSHEPAARTNLGFPDSADFHETPEWKLAPLVNYLKHPHVQRAPLAHTGFAGSAAAAVFALGLYAPFAFYRRRRRISKAVTAGN